MPKYQTPIHMIKWRVFQARNLWNRVWNFSISLLGRATSIFTPLLLTASMSGKNKMMSFLWYTTGQLYFALPHGYSTSANPNLHHEEIRNSPWGKPLYSSPQSMADLAYSSVILLAPSATIPTSLEKGSSCRSRHDAVA